MRIDDNEMEKIVQEALDHGFSHVGKVEVSTLKPMNEVRSMCAAGKCNAYGKNWMCPPACGTVEECTERIRQFDNGLLLQVTGQLEDDFDAEAIMEAGARLKTLAESFADKLRKSYDKVMLLSAGACDICKKCAYPEPCRFPDKATSAMEGYALLVTQVCAANGMKYYYGPQTITYHAVVLF